MFPQFAVWPKVFSFIFTLNLGLSCTGEQLSQFKYKPSQCSNLRGDNRSLHRWDVLIVLLLVWVPKCFHVVIFPPMISANAHSLLELKDIFDPGMSVVEFGIWRKAEQRLVRPTGPLWRFSPSVSVCSAPGRLALQVLFVLTLWWPEAANCRSAEENSASSRHLWRCSTSAYSARVVLGTKRDLKGTILAHWLNSWWRNVRATPMATSGIAPFRSMFRYEIRAYIREFAHFVCSRNKRYSSFGYTLWSFMLNISFFF